MPQPWRQTIYKQMAWERKRKRMKDCSVGRSGVEVKVLNQSAVLFSVIDLDVNKAASQRITWLLKLPELKFFCPLETEKKFKRQLMDSCNQNSTWSSVLSNNTNVSAKWLYKPEKNNSLFYLTCPSVHVLLFERLHTLCKYIEEFVIVFQRIYSCLNVTRYIQYVHKTDLKSIRQ